LAKRKFREKGGERNNIGVRKFPLFSGFFFSLDMKGVRRGTLGWYEIVA